MLEGRGGFRRRLFAFSVFPVLSFSTGKSRISRKGPLPCVPSPQASWLRNKLFSTGKPPICGVCRREMNECLAQWLRRANLSCRMSLSCRGAVARCAPDVATAIFSDSQTLPNSLFELFGDFRNSRHVGRAGIQQVVEEWRLYRRLSAEMSVERRFDQTPAEAATPAEENH